MMSLEGMFAAWQVLALSGVGPLLFAAWGGVQWWLKRGDSRDEMRLTVAERRDRLAMAEREALSKEQLASFERIEADRDRAYAEAERERARRLAAEIDRDRWSALARHYYRLSGDILHALKGARQMVAGFCEMATPPSSPPAWKNFDVPIDIEAPLLRKTTE